MNHLDLFSGIGGFALAARWSGIKTVAFCEIEPYAQKVLKKNFPSVPVFSDVRKLKRSDIYESVDIITGGFPCQPFSVAGRKKGAEDDRDLWPEMCRVIKEFKPTWIIGENVANFVSMAFHRTKTDLESEGYEVQPFIIPACGVGAPHKRDRVWILANARCSLRQRPIKPRENEMENQEQDANIDQRPGCWKFEPDVGRVAHGVPHRVDRLRGLGNAIVPQIAYQIMKEINLK
jgi:DNA (cytosine-5)-methyltransferase 1